MSRTLLSKRGASVAKSRGHILVIYAIFVVLFAALSDLTCGFLYRTMTGHPFVLRAAPLETLLVPEKSPAFHHALPKFSSADREWALKSYRQTTNSLGFRDAKMREVPLESSKRRLVFIGDSMTEGVGVDYENTFAGLIDDALSARGIEVLNAATISYSPIIYYHRVKYLLEQEHLRFTDLIVYLDISDAQDENYYYIDADGAVANKSDYIHPYVHLMRYPYPLGLKAVSRSMNGLVNNTIIFSTAFMVTFFAVDAVPQPLKSRLMLSPYALQTQLARALWTVEPELYEKWGKNGLERMNFYMSKLKTLLDAHGVKLKIAVYPWPDQIERADLNSIQVSYWKKWSEEQGVGFLNYFPSFINSDSSVELRRVIQQNFIQNDTHWNEAGHKIMADYFLANFL